MPQVLIERVEQKKFGRKSGEGFYLWRDGKPQRPPAPDARDTDPPPDLEDRLILPMLNEAVAVLREGVVEDADLLDAGAIFGTGFAPFRGGPLHYAADARRRSSDGAARRARAALRRALSAGSRMEPG